MELIEKINQAISYPEYLISLEKVLSDKIAKDKNDKMENYIFLNLKRMKRINKKYEPAPYLTNLIKSIDVPITWLAITEGWCGDAAHVLPILEKLSSESSFINLKVILRDEHPELMDQFLTNGARSIPKIIAINQFSEVLYVWGPRPSNAQKIVEAYKNGQSVYSNYEAMSIVLQKWYHEDKYLGLEEELKEFIEAQIESKEKTMIRS